MEQTSPPTTRNLSLFGLSWQSLGSRIFTFHATIVRNTHFSFAMLYWQSCVETSVTSLTRHDCCRQSVKVRRARIDGVYAGGTTSARPQQYRLLRGVSHDGQHEHAATIRRQNRVPRPVRDWLASLTVPFSLQNSHVL